MNGNVTQVGQDTLDQMNSSDALPARPNEVSENQADLVGGAQPYSLMQNNAFVKFVEENHIDPKVYQLAGALPRYIRTNPQYTPPVSREVLEKAFDGTVTSVPWLPGGAITNPLVV
ncbi:hypothetical protein SARC_11546 [Sphaeroforma arctica JP610]|uniref:Uncharacterized protein n=1 Tax=Sphaeroforma arctica JP610 TaxID=667725 RepID=A0A0L0FGP6_9EUKA|nr:hypothetical protein SARC_11546 [Sphaeroforma arctica JP610]KNC75940.1 hypothetical protein SARC_11546 [Sphaeroforma arctica JP610]|eukprot:XP_014149842.1 hypothetical protein SARC_11546 [Sphaeroforma arctica JP610]